MLNSNFRIIRTPTPVFAHRFSLHTNIVVSALLWGGKPFQLLQAATDGDLELYTSPVLLEELRGVLGREHLAARLAQQRSTVEQAIGRYGELAISLSCKTPLRLSRSHSRIRSGGSSDRSRPGASHR